MTQFDDEFDDIIDRFERARRESPSVDVADYLPPEDESRFRAIATELLRVDLQYGWQNGTPTSLSEYQKRFPNVLNNRQHQATQNVTKSERVSVSFSSVEGGRGLITSIAMK